MKTIIHVNRNVLATNKKYGRSDPAIIIRQGKKRAYAKLVKIGDNTYMVQNEEKPLDCGARVWLTTTETVIPLE